MSIITGIIDALRDTIGSHDDIQESHGKRNAQCPECFTLRSSAVQTSSFMATFAQHSPVVCFVVVVVVVQLLRRKTMRPN